MRALIDSRSKVNVMHFNYVTKLGLCTRKVDIGIENINRSHLNIFEIVIADCLVKNKLERI